MGELDISNAESLKEKMYSLLEEEMIDIKIDLSQLEYIDSTGLGVMIGVLKKLKLNDREIYMYKPKSNVKKIFAITGLDKIFKLEG
jgi:anti-sigma B factor antagonist